MSEHCSVLSDRDPPGWYECRYVFESPDDRVARYWDGERLRLNPRNSSWYGLEAYADFRRLVYEPTPQPGVAELVAARDAEIEQLRRALAEAIDLTSQVRNDVSRKLESLRNVLWSTGLSRPKALAAVEAAQERGE